MPETDSTQTTELPDVRPAEGEYFYTSNTHIFPKDALLCFVCGEKVGNMFLCHYTSGIVQCMAAANRIVLMFRPRATYAVVHTDENSYVTVSACEKHKRNTKILCRLIEDGIITVGRVKEAVIAAISPEEFHELVATEARTIWDSKQVARRHANWCHAWEFLRQELGHIPSPTQHCERAHQLWLERKDTQAFEDWLIAEKKVGALYTVATK